MCKCVYTEIWFYLFLLPPNPSMEFCIFWVEGDIGGDMLSLIICLSYGLDQTLEGISCVCPCATYLCMCYRRNRWAVSQLESTIRMSGVSGRAFFFISPSFPSWLNLELLDWHLNTTCKGHFTSGSFHYTERVNSAGKGNPEDTVVVHRKVMATLVGVVLPGPQPHELSSQVSLSTAQGIFNAAILATLSAVLRSFINLVSWFSLYCESPVHSVMYCPVMSLGHNYLHI